MAYVNNFDASNKADFIIEISATDETNTSIDFTGAEVTVAIKDNGCQKLSVSIGYGITLTDDPTILQVHFTPEQIATLCVGSYIIGGVYRFSGVIEQLFVGAFSVYDGVADL